MVLAGREPATPATPGEPPPASCVSQTHDCITATFLGYSHHDDGTTTLSYRITNNCTETVDYVAIETGHWTRVTPTDGGHYTGTLGDYTTQWTGPVDDILIQGIRFTNAHSISWIRMRRLVWATAAASACPFPAVRLCNEG